MGSRYRKPETARLEISNGDWLLVRKHLTAGDQRDAHVRILKDGNPSVYDANHMGIAMIASYLLDWNITDADDQPIVIRDAGYEFIYAALRAMDPESFTEILKAVDAHDDAMIAEREHQKKVATGAPAPSPISTSVG